MATTFDELDDETANLILRLQLEDIEELTIAGPAVSAPTVRCVSCTEDFTLDNISEGSCEHAYCRA